MPERPRSYRSEVVEPMLHSVAAGECCSLVGISGVGKSNLLQHLQQADVLQKYASDQQLRLVVIDANLMADWTPWGFFEGVAEALLATLGGELPAPMLEALGKEHERVLTTGNAALALRQCEATLGRLCAGRRIVLLFDEFDAVFTQLSGSVLRNLRGLRDRYKYRLMYVTVSRQPLARLRDQQEWDAVEPFVELLSLRELSLGPLSAADAADEVRRFAARHQHEVSPALSAAIVAQSGGHPALLRALTQLAVAAPQALARPAELHLVPTVQLECSKIWHQLTGDEQDDLLPVADHRPFDPRRVQHLALKGLLRDEDGAFTLFSPVMRDYIVGLRRAPTSAAPIIWLDPARNALHYYGSDVRSEFTRLEYRLLRYLWERQGQICEAAEIAETLHPGESLDDLTRIHVLARRVIYQLKTLNPGMEVPLRNHRGQGYQLIVE
jgi:energy-coupling factor transporter ATP-binding protein EcfA2